MWVRLAKSSFPPHLFSFMAGVFASFAVNLFAQTLIIEKVLICPIPMAMSISLFLLASAGAVTVAWYLDDAHSQWVREGRPVDSAHIEDIVEPKRTAITIAVAATAIAILGGGYLLYLAILPL